MAHLSKRLSRRTRHRAAGEHLAQAFAVASQMALLYPPGVDDWMRSELDRGEDRAGSATVHAR